MSADAVKVSVYINEADQWQRQPLHLEILRMLHVHGLAGGTVLHAVAGFTGQGDVQSTSPVDVGSRLPLVVEFIDTVEAVERVMPLLKQMAGNRLIIRQVVQRE